MILLKTVPALHSNPASISVCTKDKEEAKKLRKQQEKAAKEQQRKGVVLFAENKDATFEYEFCYILLVQCMAILHQKDHWNCPCCDS